MGRLMSLADEKHRLIIVIDEICIRVVFDSIAEGIEPIIVDQAAEIMSAIAGIELPTFVDEIFVPGDDSIEIEHLEGGMMAARIF